MIDRHLFLNPEKTSVSFREEPEPNIVFPTFSFKDYEVDLLPRTSGCYGWVSPSGDYLYVGTTENFRERIPSYRTGFDIFGGEFCELRIWICASHVSLERFLLKKHHPYANRREV